MGSDWITTTEAIKLTGYNPIYLRVLIRMGKIEGQKWGRDWQVSRSSLNTYLRKGQKSGDKRRGAKDRS